jgi:hypothetical protein
MCLDKVSMDDKEKKVQRALGTLTYYVVSLKIRSRADKPITSARFIMAGNASDAGEEAIRRCMQENSTVRQDQISVVNIHKFDIDEWRK